MKGRLHNMMEFALDIQHEYCSQNLNEISGEETGYDFQRKHNFKSHSVDAESQRRKRTSEDKKINKESFNSCKQITTFNNASLNPFISNNNRSRRETGFRNFFSLKIASFSDFFSFKSLRGNSEYPNEECYNRMLHKESYQVQTLENALIYFKMYHRLEDLDCSLEDVRRNEKTEKDHENFIKQIDKEFLKLSVKHHPDKVEFGKNIEVELAKAQKLQAALNATRTVLKYLNAVFIADISTEHKFQFYTKLNISSLCNEDEVKCRILEFKLKFYMISRIKKQNIISQTHDFLIESRKCVDSYLDNILDFEVFSNIALSHLYRSIEGYKKLDNELVKEEKRCIIDKDERMLSIVQNMARDNKRDLMLLVQLAETAKLSLKGNFQIFNTDTFMDPYLVSPFAWYINVILMCNIMLKCAKGTGMLKMRRIRMLNDELSDLMPLYHLSACYSGNKCDEGVVMDILNEKHSDLAHFFKSEMCKKKIKSKFRELLNEIKVDIETKFKLDHYTKVMTTKILELNLEKCTMMMKEFEEKKKEVSEGIKEFRKKTEEIDEMFKETQEMLQTYDDFNLKMQERLAASDRLAEKLDNLFPEQL